MKASFPQQAGQSPLSVTRSRQAGQSGGSAVSSPRRKLARRPCVRCAKREDCTVAAVSMAISLAAGYSIVIAREGGRSSKHHYFRLYGGPRLLDAPFRGA